MADLHGLEKSSSFATTDFQRDVFKQINSTTPPVTEDGILDLWKEYRISDVQLIEGENGLRMADLLRISLEQVLNNSSQYVWDRHNPDTIRNAIGRITDSLREGTHSISWEEKPYRLRNVKSAVYGVTDDNGKVPTLRMYLDSKGKIYKPQEFLFQAVAKELKGKAKDEQRKYITDYIENLGIPFTFMVGSYINFPQNDFLKALEHVGVHDKIINIVDENFGLYVAMAEAFERADYREHGVFKAQVKRFINSPFITKLKSNGQRYSNTEVLSMQGKYRAYVKVSRAVFDTVAAMIMREADLKFKNPARSEFVNRRRHRVPTSFVISVHDRVEELDPSALDSGLRKKVNILDDYSGENLRQMYLNVKSES